MLKQPLSHFPRDGHLTTNSVPSQSKPWRSWYEAVSVIASSLVALIGCLVLAGWVFGIAPLKAFLSGLVTMKANTAVALILAAFSLLLSRTDRPPRRLNLVSQSLPVIVGCIGLLTLFQYVMGWDFHIDQILIRDFRSLDTPYPGRMAPATALCFLLIGTAIWLMRRGQALLAQSLTFTAAFVSLLALVGYLYNVESLRRIGPYSSVAVPTAVAFLLLCLAILFARPSHGLMAIATSDTAGGLMVRRLLPAAIVLPVVLGWIRLSGQRLGYYDTEFGLALMVVSSIVSLCALILWNARALQRMDAAHRRLEEQLRQTQKMEAIGRLAGGVAHDFNNLLTAIIGYSQMVRGQLDPRHVSHPDLEEIEKAGKRAASLTNQLLAFSRRQVLQPRVLDLNSALAEMEKMLRRLIGEDVELTVNLDPSLWQIRADPGQIEQVILNLAINARDAMPDGGKLAIETKNVVLDKSYTTRHIATQPGPHVMLAISDTGIGMDKETQARIFEPFFTTKAQGKGTGLGLSTVYGVVKQSGGSIWIYSEPNKGTTFKVYFPQVEGSPERVEQQEARIERKAGGEHILLVEDEELVRKFACQVLRKSGYTVLDAATPHQAVSICNEQQGQIHLLISDVIMPGMSGRQLAEQLASLRPDMKVLFMSGYTDDAIVKHGVLESNTPFLQKPFTPEALMRKVQEVLSVQH